MSLRVFKEIRKREISGESRRASVRNAIPVRSTVLVSALRRPGTNAPPKVGSRKYFCASSQVMISRVDGPGWQGRWAVACECSQGMWLGGGAPPIMSAGIPSEGHFSGSEDVLFA